MLIEEIIKTYGKFDYYEMNTGKIFDVINNYKIESEE